MLERPAHKPPKRPKASREREARRRARERRGEMVLRNVVVPEFWFLTALIEAGYIGDVESRDRRLVEAAAAAVLQDWARQWLQKV